ncbi:MAG TPA: hypothetical protein PKB06_11060, partial [Actinotalea sp.]|nr:hypothetical protein [Actinotalea sp.]
MTSRLSRTGRAAAAAVIALATTATLSGCLGQTPMTLRDYTPGDGVSLRLGDLDAQALVVLTAAEGEPGTIVGALRNVGARDLSVTIGLPDSVTEVEVPAGSSVLLGPQQVEVA